MVDEEEKKGSNKRGRTKGVGSLFLLLRERYEALLCAMEPGRVGFWVV